MKYSEYSKTGRLNSGDIFLIANQGLTDNFGIYAKDMISGLLEANPTNYSVNFNDFDNVSFIGHQMGAKGEMLHANNILLNKARNKLATGQSFTVMRAGDGLVNISAGVSSRGLFAVTLGNLIDRYGVQGYGYEFPHVLPTGAGGRYLGGTATHPWTSNVWLDNMIYGITGAPDYAFFAPTAASSTYKFLSDTIDLYYIEGPGLGSFQVYTGGLFAADGNFGLYTGVNASAVNSGSKLIRINYATPGYRQVRVDGSGVSSQNIAFPMVAFYNAQDQINKIRYYDYSNQGGVTYSFLSGRPNQTRSLVRDPIFSGINPDLILTESIVDNISTTELSGYYSYLLDIKSKWPEATVVICAAYPSPYGRETGVKQLRSGAVQCKVPFFDGHTPFVDYLTWSGRGYAIVPPDGTHPSSSGANAYSQLLWDWLEF